MEGWVTIGTKLDTKSFDKQIAEVESELRTLEKRYEETKNMQPFKGQKEDLQSIGLEIEKVNNKLVDLKKKQANLNKIELKQTETYFKGLNTSMGSMLKKIAKWAVAIVGIRSAYSLIRQSVSTLSQYDNKLAKDIEYIRFAIATSLKPIIEWVVKAIYTILSGIGNIVKAFTGINIFAKASAKNMKSMAGSAEEIKKSTAGFDKLNILSSNTSQASGSSIAPSFDLSQDNLFKNWNLSDFIEKGKEVATNFAEGINNFFATTNWSQLAQTISEGISGIIDIIITLIKDTDWAEVGKSIVDFLLNIDWIGLGVKIIELLVEGLLTIGDLMIGIVDEIIKAFEDPNFLENILNAGITLATALIKGIGSILEKIIEIFSKILSWIYNNFIKPVIKFFGNMISKIIGFFKEIITKVADTIGNVFKGVINAVISAIETILNVPIKAINKLIGVINKIPGINLGTISTFKLPRLAKGGIVNMPGRGINYGGANIGEGLGQGEGVIPLSNEASLEKIGTAIGKHMNITINLTNEMDGRIIAKILKEINNESNFAINGG